MGLLRYFLVGCFMLASVGCGSSAPAGPPNLTVEEEQAILESVNQAQTGEAPAAAPATP